MLKIFSFVEHFHIAIIFSHLESKKINGDKNDVNDCKENIRALLVPVHRACLQGSSQISVIILREFKVN